MLYDPKWNEPKPDIFALDTLIGWLEKQPADKIYSYTHPRHCLLAQYFETMTGSSTDVMQYTVCFLDISYPLPKGWDEIASGTNGTFSDSCRTFWTFKAALKRAKRLRTKVAVGSILSRIPQLLGLT